MNTLIMFARYEIGILLTVLAATLVYQMLTGQINTQGLISEKTKTQKGGVSPARLQLLLTTLAFGFYVLSQIVKLGVFPEIDMKWVLLLGGSHSVFLGGKSLQMFTSQTKSE